MLLQKRLVGCVSFVRQSDLYWWKGKLVGTKGVVAFNVAPKKHYKKIEQFVKRHHSYQVPCILELPIGRSLPVYEQWLKKVTH